MNTDDNLQGISKLDHQLKVSSFQIYKIKSFRKFSLYVTQETGQSKLSFDFKSDNNPSFLLNEIIAMQRDTN